jgi:hypothetical protein
MTISDKRMMICDVLLCSPDHSSSLFEFGGCNRESCNAESSGSILLPFVRDLGAGSSGYFVELLTTFALRVGNQD